MALTLRNGIVLQKSEPEGCVLLYDREPSYYPAPVFRLHPLHAMVLALFDGTKSIDDVAGIVAGVFDRQPEQGRQLLDALLKRYRQFLAEAPDSGAAGAVDPAALLFPVRMHSGELREPAPMALFWVVTECCTKKCLYCYKDARFVAYGGAGDMTISTARMVELIGEAADIGVTTVVLSGGEPFLRPDLFELIGVMTGRGIDVVPITKERITGERMHALARSGAQALHVSLDSHRPGSVDFLTGVNGAFDGMVATLAAAAEHGVPVVLRPLLTSVNVRDFDGVVELADAYGVTRILADFYGSSCGRHDAAFAITADDERWVRETCAELHERFPRIAIELKADHRGVSGDVVRKGCVEGLRGMTFLPDGRVTKCEHWRFGEELIYGDLRTQSIMEVWQSERITEITGAPRPAYERTVCGRCKQFTECNERRGRCTMSTLLEHGTPFAPDVYCPIGAFKKRSGYVTHA
ncbi:MAG TPA: radical SAM protein [Thermoanaerobaculia bacterium]|nr:radical SAM protein [Thermoanaerobaculia bacterium]